MTILPYVCSFNSIMSSIVKITTVKTGYQYEMGFPWHFPTKLAQNPSSAFETKKNMFSVPPLPLSKQRMNKMTSKNTMPTRGLRWGLSRRVIWQWLWHEHSQVNSRPPRRSHVYCIHCSPQSLSAAAALLTQAVKEKTARSKCHWNVKTSTHEHVQRASPKRLRLSAKDKRC